MAALKDVQRQQNPNVSNAPRRQRQTQRQISSGTGSCCSGGSGTSSGKKLTRRLSRRLSDVFARSSSQDSSNNTNIAKAARRDSLTDVREKIASGNATYVPCVQHPLIKSYLIYDEAEDGDGDFTYEECKEKNDAASYQAAANVKTSRAA